AAHAGAEVSGQVGQHVHEVRAKPQQRRGDAHPEARGRLPGERRGRVGGQRAEPEQVHDTGPRRRLQAEVVGPPGPDEQREDAHGEQADRRRHGQRGHDGHHGGDPQGAHGDLAARDRLVGPPRGHVPCRVAGVIGPANGELPGEHGRRDQDRPESGGRRFRRQHRRPRGDGKAGTWVTGDKQCAHADHGPPVDMDQLSLSVRLALKGANPAEWLALRTGLVPTAAAEAWGGMATSGVLVAAVRTGITARLAKGHATADKVAADLGLDPLPTRLLLDCLRSAGHGTARAGTYQLSRSARRWLDPASPLSVAGYVAGTGDYWPWWQGLEHTVRTGTSSGS